MNDAKERYADIIDRPHHVSRTHAQMPTENRAAQFAPFAALTGYDDLIRESERETEQRILPDENARDELDAKLLHLLRTDPPEPADFTVFVPDDKKAGGAYETVSGRIVRFDAFYGMLILDNGQVIDLSTVVSIESEAFNRA